MSPESIPRPGLDHTLPDHLSREQLAVLWLDLLDANDQLLLAGIKATLPVGVELRDAYRDWCEQHSREHFAMLENMAERFNQTQVNQTQADYGGVGSSENA